MAQAEDNMPITDPDHPDHYQAKNDAQTMQDHAAILADSDRHAKAHQMLQHQAATTKQAVAHSSKNMSGKVKKGLKAAFPSSGKSPFQRAEGNQSTPFQKAAEGE